MNLRPDEGIPIIKGKNDCFFEENSIFLHENRIYDKYPGFTCNLYRSAKPHSK
ncbi:MAG: hypothetical protein ACFE9N_15250 [Promethearchaeota archaeon]